MLVTVNINIKHYNYLNGCNLNCESTSVGTSLRYRKRQVKNTFDFH